MKASRLRWEVEYDARHDWLEVHLYKRVGGIFETVPWRRFMSESLWHYSRDYKVENVAKHIEIMKREILKKFIKNTSVQQLLAQVTAAASGPVTAQELKDAADALEKEKLEAAG